MEIFAYSNEADEETWCNFTTEAEYKKVTFHRKTTKFLTLLTHVLLFFSSTETIFIKITNWIKTERWTFYLEKSEIVRIQVENSPEEKLSQTMLSPTESFLDLLSSNSSVKNVTNITDIYIPYEQRPETYIVPIIFLIIFVVGVIGNGTLVIIFFRHRSMRNIPNT